MAKKRVVRRSARKRPPAPPSPFADLINSLVGGLESLMDNALDDLQDQLLAQSRTLDGFVGARQAGGGSNTPPHARQAPSGPRVPSLYEILGVFPTAEPEIVKAAYMAIVKKYHPDINPGNTDAAKRMSMANTAYEVLKDPQKRAQYNRSIGI